MSNVRSGLLFSMLGKYMLRVVNLLSTVLIARLLTPTEIGTFAIASSFVMILTEVKLLGANAYLIRADVLDEAKIRKAYGMTILMCWGISAALILGSGGLADFFKHEEIQQVFIILALSFLLAPYISVPDAILSRSYRFKQISIIELSAAPMQFLVTLTLIYHGFSFYALAWGQFSGMVCRFVLSLYFTRETKIYRPKFSGLGEIARLGIFTSAANIVRRIHYSASDLVIGRQGTPGEVGVFSRGMGFIDFISQIVLDGVGGVAQPYMSELKRRGVDIAAAYIKTTALLCSLVWPILAVAGFAALPAIRLLFGDQWDQSAPIASVLAVWMLVKVVSFFSPQLLIAVGQESMMFKRDLSCFVLLIVSLVLSYSYGLAAMGVAFLLNGVVECFITLWMLHRSVQLQVGSLIRSLFKPALVAGVCLAGSVGLDQLYPFVEGSPIAVFGLLAVSMPVVWLLTTKLLGLQIYAEVMRLIQAIVRRVRPVC